MPLDGTGVRRHHGYQRNKVEARLAELRRAGRPVDVARAGILRDLADAADRERSRVTGNPDVSSGTHGRILTELGELWDRWDPPTQAPAADPFADIVAQLLAEP